MNDNIIASTLQALFNFSSVFDTKTTINILHSEAAIVAAKSLNVCISLFPVAGVTLARKWNPPSYITCESRRSRRCVVSASLSRRPRLVPDPMLSAVTPSFTRGTRADVFRLVCACVLQKWCQLFLKAKSDSIKHFITLVQPFSERLHVLHTQTESNVYSLQKLIFVLSYYLGGMGLLSIGLWLA